MTFRFSSSRLSLRTRLIFVAVVLLLFVLSVVGWGTSRAFYASVEQNAADALRNQILLILSSLEVEEGQVIVPLTPSDPRLGQVNSALFAQIVAADGRVLWRSPSLLEDRIELESSKISDIEYIPSASLSNGLALVASRLNVVWESDTGTVQFTVEVAEARRIYEQRALGYTRSVAVLLGFVGIAVILILMLMGVWLIRPLRRITNEVREVEVGDRQSFNEDYPSELNQLTHHLNVLLDVEEQRIERHKQVLGNLAHSLKTPLAVLQGMRQEGAAQEQLDAMRSIIDYQLQNASTVGRRRFAKPIDASQVCERVVRSVQRLYADRSIDIVAEIEQHVLFYGDEGDWHELVGNLMDNACKWASTQVRLLLSAKPNSEHRSGLRLTVQDDGPGMTPAQQKNAMKRGVRLDTQTSGQGLGLSIVADIVDAYQAEMQLDSMPDQGTIWTVEFE